MTKSELRRMIRQRFLATTAKQRAQWARTICEDILHDKHIIDAKYIMAFYPLPDEVDIVPLLDALCAMHKVVLLPEVTSPEDMLLREYTGSQNLNEGMFGTLNPTGKIFTDYEKITVVLVPGVAFTATGVRLGRGKGFYDRFLTHVSGAYKRAVCFPYQIVDDIPCEVHDVKMDYV